MWLANLKRMKTQSGLTTKEISRQSGIPEPTLEKLFAGATKDPKLTTIQQLVHFFGYTLDDLDNSSIKKQKASSVSEEAMKLARDYDDLDSHGQRIVRLVADEEKVRYAAEVRAAAMREHREQIEASEMVDVEKVIRFSIPGYTMPLSAGTGQEAGQEYPENYTLVKEPPRGTSFIARVSGNSMEPTYHDGDLVFVHSTEEIPAGKVGAFLMNGQQWVKELGNGVLISHNTEYDPIPMREDIRCQGLVLGVCDESYLE